jgi:hypothetical protein
MVIRPAFIDYPMEKFPGKHEDIIMIGDSIM